MTAITRPIRRLFGRTEPIGAAEPAQAPAQLAELPGVTVDIPESDPLFAFLQAAPGPVDLSRLELASPALDEMRRAGVALVVPLVTQGELIGTLNLGPRLSEQATHPTTVGCSGAGRPGRPGDPRRPAGPGAGSRGCRA